MNWKLLKKHPFNVVPNADEQELKELEQSIVDNGFDPRFPIWTFQGPNDKEPMIIDGAQRHAICVSNDIEPLVREFIGSSSDAIQFILKSIKRRNLTAGQRAVVFNELSTQMQAEIEFEARQRERNDKGVFQEAPGGPMGKVSEIMSEQAGVGKSTWKRVKRIEKYSPDLYDAVKEGRISAKAAERQIQQREASGDMRIKMSAKKMVMDALNDAVKIQGPGFIDQIVKEMKKGDRINLKFTIKRDA